MPQLRLGFTLPCRSLSSPLPGYGSVRVPTLRSLRVLHFKSFSPSSGISPPGGREERLGEGLPAQAPDCTHLRGLLPCLVSTKGRIFLPPGAEKKPSAFHLLTARCTQVEEWGAEPPEGPGCAPPRSQMHRHSPGTHQSLLAC